MEICKLMTLSTGHLTRKTRQQLRTDPNDLDVPVYPKGEYGWFLYPGENIEGLPSDICACIELARQNGCSVLCFDSDGPITPNLPDYSNT